MSAGLLDLYPPSNVLMAPAHGDGGVGVLGDVPLAVDGDAVGDLLPRRARLEEPEEGVRRGGHVQHDGTVGGGDAHAARAVPKTGSMAPLGATNSGLTANTSEMRPRLARFSA